MNVDVYKYKDMGLMIDPESDTKLRTVILVGKQVVKCNPRHAMFYITDETIQEDDTVVEALKAYCAENKIMMICPSCTCMESLEKIFKEFFSEYLELNILRDEMCIGASSQAAAVKADAFKEYIMDEYDADLGDVQIITL